MPTSHTTVVMSRIPRIDLVGQRLPDHLVVTAESISTGLANRLHRHAANRLADAGFSKMIDDCNVEIYTMDADDKPADRSYCVRFKNNLGGYIEVVEILTRHGWPSLDHGFAIGEK